MPQIRIESNATVRLIDEFNSFNAVISTADYDIVNGYFQTFANNRTAADNLTSLFFLISSQTNVNPVDLLKQIQGPDQGLSPDASMAFYLNMNRPKHSQYGVGSRIRSNPSVQRNIIL